LAAAWRQEAQGSPIFADRCFESLEARSSRTAFSHGIQFVLGVRGANAAVLEQFMHMRRTAN
jgi:hypothetical protein